MAAQIQITPQIDLDNGTGDEDGDGVEDEAIRDDYVAPERYDITSFGADYDVEGLVARITRGDIVVPDFQRAYVWNIRMASRFIESLLLGLPVPGIFLARDTNKKLIVIDGQQRLKTLEYYYGGYFRPEPGQNSQRVFKLYNVQPRFEGLTCEALAERDRRQLNDSIIHATVVQQNSPIDGDTSVYHIFERLNNGGLKLRAQEIRGAIYHGKLIDLVGRLNDYVHWRAIFGKKNMRLKDQELILRFLALYLEGHEYQRPMNEFINRFTQNHRNADDQFLDRVSHVFRSTVDVAYNCLSDKAFKPEGILNAAVFDSVMVAIARRLTAAAAPSCEKLAAAYRKLLEDGDYREAVSSGTSHEGSVKTRLEKATRAFSSLC